MFSYLRQFCGSATVRFPGQAQRCCLYWTQFHIKLPRHLTDTHNIRFSYECILLDFSICKTPGKHVKLRWKARCLQISKEIRYLSCQLKWTWQMYFWLKLKLWALSCYPQWCRQMHSVCLTKASSSHLSLAAGSNNSLPGLAWREGPCPSVEYTEANS